MACHGGIGVHRSDVDVSPFIALRCCDCSRSDTVRHIRRVVERATGKSRTQGHIAQRQGTQRRVHRAWGLPSPNNQLVGPLLIILRGHHQVDDGRPVVQLHFVPLLIGAVGTFAIRRLYLVAAHRHHQHLLLDVLQLHRKRQFVGFFRHIDSELVDLTEGFRDFGAGRCFNHEVTCQQIEPNRVRAGSGERVVVVVVAVLGGYQHRDLRCLDHAFIVGTGLVPVRLDRGHALGLGPRPRTTALGRSHEARIFMDVRRHT